MFFGPDGTAAGSSKQLLSLGPSKRRSSEERREQAAHWETERTKENKEGWSFYYLASVGLSPGPIAAQSWVLWQSLHLGV